MMNEVVRAEVDNVVTVAPEECSGLSRGIKASKGHPKIDRGMNDTWSLS